MTPSLIAASPAPGELLFRVGELKTDFDFLIRQLSEGEYLSVDTFANNCVRLIRHIITDDELASHQFP